MDLRGGHELRGGSAAGFVGLTSFSDSPLFEFFERTRPVFPQQAAEGAICQQTASGLAGGAVVRLV
jgi:hypothetical protein